MAGASGAGSSPPEVSVEDIPVSLDPGSGDDEWLTTGAVLGGKYAIERVLGTGGMATVVAAKDVAHGRTVAVKVMHREQAADADSVRRFMREARAASKLTSENTVRIYDVGRLPTGLPYLVMEYLDGEDLEEIQSRRQLSVEEVIDYVLQATAAVSEAHANGLVHRDLKPQNLFLARTREGKPVLKVLDFGLAKELPRNDEATDTSLTTDNMILGSPHFMSPEQVRTPGKVDGRTDIWALGATLYHLLVGEPPFVSPTMFGLLARIMGDPPPRVRERRPDVPSAIDGVIVRCLDREPDNRATIDELVHALTNARASLQPGRRTTSSSAMTAMQTAPMPVQGRGRTVSMHDLAGVKAEAERASLAPAPAATPALPSPQAPRPPHAREQARPLQEAPPQVQPRTEPPRAQPRTEPPRTAALAPAPNAWWPYAIGGVLLLLGVMAITMSVVRAVTKPRDPHVLPQR